jgi:hypothetical protein
MILRPSPATGLAKPARRQAWTREGAQALALAALDFLAGDPERISRFLSLSGLDPNTLREAAAEPGFFSAVLDYLASDDSLIVAFADHAGIAPERVGEARHVLAPEADFS